MKLFLDTIAGCGGFGRVYVARVTSSSSSTTVPTGARVAVKKMHITKHTPNSVLRHEACVCLLLAGHAGIPEVYAWGRSQYYDYLGLELLGAEVSPVHKDLTLRNFAIIACAMLDALEHVHSRGLIHCDIKPSNFLFGSSDSAHAGEIKLIDFGLTTYFRDPLSGAHVPELSTGHMRGTEVYSSIPGHMHRTLARRDDLESLAYTLAELVRGQLPWAKTHSSDILLRQKVAWRAAELPTVLTKFIEYTRVLAFAAEPDYAHWRAAFRALVPGLPDNAVFDPADDGPCIARSDAKKNNDDGVVDPARLPPVDAPPSKDSDDSIPDSDDGWVPTSSWAPPFSIRVADLIGDEQATVRAHLEHIEEPPAMETPWLYCQCSPECTKANLFSRRELNATWVHRVMGQGA